MAITSARVTVSSTPVAISDVETDVVSGSVLMVKNTSANAADLGASDVAAGAGYDLAAGQLLTIGLRAGEQLFAIRSGGADAVISVLRIGV